ncbi:MAG TPA: PAS domain S-box protein [Pyrinomonadaceae bacterium]|jgi:PAS domain S-box-containing protein
MQQGDARAAAGQARQQPASPESEELLRLMIGGVQDFAIFASDMDGRILSWNPGVGHLLGYEEPEWVGQHSSIIFTPEDRAEGADTGEREKAARDGRALDERWHVRRDGSRFWSSGLLMALRDGQGRLRGYSKMLRDATRSKQAEERLSQYAAIIENAADGIVAVTLDQVIRLWNGAAQRMYGYTAEEALGHHFSLILPPERAAEMTQAIERLRRGESIQHMETERVGKGGSRIPVSVSISPIRDATGEIVGVSTNARDMTERVGLLRREQEARARAEEANRLKDDFLATLSHELRTPLTAILGWARLLSSGQLDQATVTRAIEIIERNAEAQKQLIEDILDVSRIITGKLTLNVEPLPPVAVIEAAIDSVRPAAEAKQIELQVLVDSHAGLISGDAARLQQVVWNLLTNAVKFTPEGGRVEVRVEAEGSFIQIKVTDTGEGIDPEFLPFIFDRFRQADATATRKRGGLGLGLAIVRHLVELHGGTVSAESKGAGQGTTFIITLPIASALTRPGQHEEARAARAKRGQAADCPPLTDLHILLVDDERDTLELLRRVLENCGARVTTASSAAEALQRMKEAKPEVLISDIGMPEQDGYALIRKVRGLQDDEGGSIPAIALTAYAREVDRRKAIRAGFQMHLTKPVEPSELTEVVARLAGRAGNPASRSDSSPAR